MKSLRLLIATVFIALSLLTTAQHAKAQCAMCTATVESNSKSGHNETNGLNHGIMYLLAAPYLAVGLCAWIWYKKYRRKDVDLNMRDQKIHLN
jgi:hypothetical protein